jgi:hypothetical protein
MPLFRKKVEEGDPSGVLEVFTPTSVLKAKREGSQWAVEAVGGDVVSALRCNGWHQAAEGVKAPKPPRRSSPAAAPDSATTSAAAEQYAGADALDLLDNSVKVIEKLLRCGDYDDDLQALLDAEESGKTRKGVVDALNARLEGG